MLGQFRRKFEYKSKTLQVHGYEFVGYLQRARNCNVYFARCVPRGEVVTIEQVPSECRKLSQPFWKWISHPNALRLLHYFCDDHFAYMVRREFNLTVASNYLLVTDNSDLRKECIQRWSNQIMRCMDYLHRQGFYHNGFDWNIVFLSGDRNAFLGGLQHLVHASSKAEVGLGDLKYCPPEGLKSGKIERDQLEAAVSWRFGAHLLQALACKLISGPHMNQFPGNYKRILSKRTLLEHVVDNQNCLVETLNITGLPPTLQSALLGFLRMSPTDRLTIGRALVSVDWFAEEYFARSNQEESAPCKCNLTTEMRPQVQIQNQQEENKKLQASGPDERLTQYSPLPPIVITHKQPLTGLRPSSTCWKTPPCVERGSNLLIVPCKDSVCHKGPWDSVFKISCIHSSQGIDKMNRHTCICNTPPAVNVPVKWEQTASPPVSAQKDLDLGHTSTWCRLTKESSADVADDTSIAACCSELSTRPASLVSMDRSNGKSKGIRMIITKKVPRRT